MRMVVGPGNAPARAYHAYMRACACLLLLSACSSSPMAAVDAGTDASMDSAVPGCDSGGGAQPGDVVACNDEQSSTVVIDGPNGPFNVVYTAYTTTLHACRPMRVRMCDELVETLEGTIQRSECTEAFALSDGTRIQCGSRHVQYAPDGTTVVRDDTSTWTRISIDWL